MAEGTIASLSDLVQVTAALEHDWGEPGWFRGHFDVGWKLVPGVYRPDVHWDLPGYEKNCGLYFKLRAPARYERVPPDDDYAAWLFTMQHYRLPTRLLDWTESPFVGLFFALWSGWDYRPDRCPAHDAELVALSPNRLNMAESGEAAIYLLTSTAVRPLIPEYLRREGWKMPGEGQKSPRALAILPKQVEPRILAQQGVFTIHASDQNIDDIPGAADYVRRFRIPRELRSELLTALARTGFRAMNLFPDLDHLSFDLRWSDQPRRKAPGRQQ